MPKIILEMSPYDGSSKWYFFIGFGVKDLEYEGGGLPVGSLADVGDDTVCIWMPGWNCLKVESKPYREHIPIRKKIGSILYSYIIGFDFEDEDWRLYCEDGC